MKKKEAAPLTVRDDEAAAASRAYVTGKEYLTSKEDLTSKEYLTSREYLTVRDDEAAGSLPASVEAGANFFLFSFFASFLSHLCVMTRQRLAASASKSPEP